MYPIRFSGDDALPPGAYDVLTEVPRKWLALSDFLTAGAATFGLNPSDETRERWRRMATAANILDGVADGPGPRDGALDAFRQIVEGGAVPVGASSKLLSSGVRAMALLNSSLAGLRSHRRCVDLALEIGGLVPRKAVTSRVLSYIRLRAYECRMTGWLIAECMADDERPAAQFARFRRWCGSFVIFCGLYDDAFCDLPADYAAGHVRVRPTWLNALVLWGSFGLFALGFFSRHPSACWAVAKSIERWAAPVVPPSLASLSSPRAFQFSSIPPLRPIAVLLAVLREAKRFRDHDGW
jgi:hypothetical protein